MTAVTTASRPAMTIPPGYRECIECHYPFQHPDPQRETCHLCTGYRSANTTTEGEKARECSECGKKFSARTRNQLTCSRKCSDTRKSRMTREVAAAKIQPLVKTCAHCGKQFATRNKRDAVCSETCRNERHLEVMRQASQRKRDRKKKNKLQPIPCAACHQLFTPRAKGHRNCSKECSKKWDVQMKAERRRKQEERQRAKEIHKECAECGKPFVTTYAARILCSDECRKARSSRQAHERYIEK